MLSLVSLQLPKVALKLLLPLGLILFLLHTMFQHAQFDKSIIDNQYKSMKSYIDSASGSISGFTKGRTIRPQNVKFKFIPTKKGRAKDILAENIKTYKEVLSQEINEPKDFDMDSIRPPVDISTYKHENATIISLVRNKELYGIKRTMQQFEKSFNAKFRYPYTFLNDEPFTEGFKHKVRTFTSAPVEFVQIPPELWNKPDTIDVNKESEAMEHLEKENVAYAKEVSYHNMCRFYSGQFQNVPELQKYKYYWRIEPNVKFYTDLNYDVFKYLAGTKKIYGFVISLYDIRQTVKTLFSETLKFLNTGNNYKYVNPNGAFQWITENQQLPKNALSAGGYSTCHFWSNFEIADMDFFRGEAYSNWFKHLESTGKFYYERWGDAPVHSLGLALFSDKDKLHWFRDIGYFHEPYSHCPNNENTKDCEKGRFDPDGNTFDQNCIVTWIDYEMKNPGAIY